jgi:uncharacterized oxidoreductase
VELLAGCVTGAGMPGIQDSGYRLGNGVLLHAFDVGAVIPSEEYGALAGALVKAVRATPPAAGCEEVLLPGDPERRTAERRAAGDLEVAEPTWRGLTAAAVDLGVRF